LNPIHEENGKWFFWDETWADRLGPYDSEKTARKKLKEYHDFLDDGYVSVAEDFI